MSDKKKTEVEQEPAPRGLVVHTDGSQRPANSGYSGWGLHGYIYEERVPTKGTGNPDYVLTANDYMTKTVMALHPNIELVTPVAYADGYGAVPFGQSHNAGELTGALNALKLALKEGVARVRIWSDSKYVCTGFTHALNWRRNGWKKADGGEPANLALWKEYVTLFDELVRNGVDVAINWCEGHAEGNLGNEMADERAFYGMCYAHHKIYDQVVELTPPEGYWKYEHNRHPFISHRRMYYNTEPNSFVPGIYCLGEHDKDDDLAGKRDSNGAYAYVELDTPEKALEVVREYSCKIADGENTIMIARVDAIYKADIHRCIIKHNAIPLRQPPKTFSALDTVARNDKELLTREHNPPMLVERCVNELVQMKQILDDWRANTDGMITTDLTPLIYESLVKTNKKGEEKRSLKLRPEFKVGTSVMNANVNYRHPSGDIRQTEIRLILGLDLLDRNALCRLEDLEPEVRLVTWSEEPSAFRFATIIKVKGAIGIWAGVYSNLRLVTH